MSKQKVSIKSHTDQWVNQLRQIIPSAKNPKNRPRLMKWIVVVGALGLLVWVLQVNKHWLIAASINGQVIPRHELSRRLMDRYGEQLLEAMIGEELIMMEARKQNVIATDAEVMARIAEIESSLNGALSLDESLRLQGVSRQEFEEQTRIQVLIEKLLADSATVSATEVSQYIEENAEIMSATTPAEQKEEAEQTLVRNKLSQQFATWFTQLKDNADIKRHLF